MVLSHYIKSSSARTSLHYPRFNNLYGTRSITRSTSHNHKLTLHGDLNVPTEMNESIALVCVGRERQRKSERDSEPAAKRVRVNACWCRTLLRAGELMCGLWCIFINVMVWPSSSSVWMCEWDLCWDWPFTHNSLLSWCVLYDTRAYCCSCWHIFFCHKLFLFVFM